MLELAAAVTAFVAATAAVLSLTSARADPAGERIARLGRNRATALEGSHSVTVQPLTSGFAGSVVRVLPHTFAERLVRALDSAGKPMTAGQFIFITLLTTFFGFTLPLLISLQSAGSVTQIGAIAAFGFGLGGALLPLLLLRRAIRRRRNAIWRSLPDACDLITLSVEAGVGVDGALRLIAQKLPGPLAEEVGVVLREIGLGSPRRDALIGMAERINLPEIWTFVQSLIQTDQLGTSLGSVLRAQAVSVRAARRQRAAEMVRKTPVKMVFPLVIFTLPTFFIITLGPIFISIVNELSD